MDGLYNNLSDNEKMTNLYESFKLTLVFKLYWKGWMFFELTEV